MLTKVRMWGNSLALRIPKDFAEETGLRKDSVVEIKLRDGVLVIEPVTSESYDLDALLAQITVENLHEEITTGAAAGNEVW